jgi:hypothetical protein
MLDAEPRAGYKKLSKKFVSGEVQHQNKNKLI